MGKVRFVKSDGSERVFEFGDAFSVMEVGRKNGVEEIVAECGGSMSCSTCHVYVDEAQLGNFPEPDELENDMLDCVSAERKPNSRLSCQLELRAVEPGQDITVTLPDSQI
ncbi:MAG: (2Fe-2S)-binding protein [Deltaproteobacteria bacterium]|nr:(2Fe-2S)-binding protein [Deltaproteobacteria bacterium]